MDDHNSSTSDDFISLDLLRGLMPYLISKESSDGVMCGLPTDRKRLSSGLASRVRIYSQVCRGRPISSSGNLPDAHVGVRSRLWTWLPYLPWKQTCSHIASDCDQRGDTLKIVRCGRILSKQLRGMLVMMIIMMSVILTTHTKMHEWASIRNWFFCLPKQTCILEGWKFPHLKKN